MDRSCLLVSSFAQIDCPTCGQGEIDDFELFEGRPVRHMRCEACSGSFHFGVFECESCGAECSVSWSSEPSPAQIRALACIACDQPYVASESL